MPSLSELEETVAQLTDDQQRRWKEVYSVEVLTGCCNPPPTFYPKITRWFAQEGDDNEKEAALTRVRRQTIVRIRNLVSCEEAAYNSLRTARPQLRSSSAALEATAQLEQLYSESCGKEKCDFCAAIERTAADEWGRITGTTGCITACNVAMASDAHGLVILPQHHPLRGLSAEIVADVFETAYAWAKCTVEHKLKQQEQQAGQETLWLPLLLWNCGMGSGASMPHGHAQVILGRGRLFGQAEASRRCAAAHHAQTGRDFWSDVLWCHQIVGLAVAVPAVRLSGTATGTEGDAAACYIVPHLTPRASHELLVFGRTLAALGRGVQITMEVLQEHFGSRCLSIGCALPALQQTGPSLLQGAQAARPGDAEWIVARVLDHTEKPTAAGNKYGTSLATWEIYGPSIDDCSPYFVASCLKEAAGSFE